jgi:hypothetical protein
MNQTLEHYLRCYCTYQQDDWATKLPLAEFVYNNSVHSTTGLRPFEAMYGWIPKIDWHDGDTVLEGEAPAASQRIKTMIEARAELARNWQKAVDSQKKHYDIKHKPMTFAVDDEVMLRAKHIKQLRPSAKLADRYLGPFRVLEVVGHHRQAYRLKLPPTYRIHDVFHVSLLEPYHRREAGVVEELPAIEVEGQEEYEVESVLAHKDGKGGRRYLVRWKGYSPADDTWEPSQHLEHAADKVKDYLSSGRLSFQPRKRQRKH